jgi:HSP20 family protein
MAGKSTAKGETKAVPATGRVSPLAVRGWDDVDRLFDALMTRPWLRPASLEWPEWAQTSLAQLKAPKVDVIDRDSEVLVRAEVPGVDKKDLDISVAENAVTIRGETRKEEKEEKGEYYRCEISTGSFARTVALPAEVDADKAKASFKDGVLELTLPKLAKSKKRSIKID